MAGLSRGDRVKWKWGQGAAEGVVRSVSTRKVTRNIEGSEITRNGTRDNPALYIEQQNGGRVLKLASEVERA